MPARGAARAEWPIWRPWNVIPETEIVAADGQFGVLGVAGCLWVFGLVDQLYSSAAMMKYLLLSLLMAAVAFL